MNCKLTNQNLQTYKGFQWILGKKEVIEIVGGKLCSSNFFHYYSDPLLAVLLNPMHANIEKPRLFTVAVGGEIKSDNGLKFGAKEMTLVEELELPVVTDTQRMAFGILCALEVCEEPTWIKWATAWLDGTDRSIEAAKTVSRDAIAIANYAAVSAAYYARIAKTNIDLLSLAKKAMEY